MRPGAGSPPPCHVYAGGQRGLARRVATCRVVFACVCVCVLVMLGSRARSVPPMNPDENQVLREDYGFGNGVSNETDGEHNTPNDKPSMSDDLMVILSPSTAL